MEFSKELSLVTRFLIRPELKSSEVYIHKPSPGNDGHWIVVVDVESDHFGRAKGSGMTMSSLNAAFVRALVELGENIIFRTHGEFEDRGGMSGGFLLSNAIVRAKYELIERDAFLFHYRTATAFLSMDNSSAHDAFVFEMQSNVSGVHCFFATTRSCAEGHGSCLLVGLGAHQEASRAKEKALGELATMKLDHERRPGWCAALTENPEMISRIPDFHHVQSRDPRNRERIRKICDVSGGSKRGGSERTAEVDGSWVIERMESPIRLVKYCRVENALLAPLKFGLPEDRAMWGAGVEPLYHPIW